MTQRQMAQAKALQPPESKPAPALRIALAMGLLVLIAGLAFGAVVLVLRSTLPAASSGASAPVLVTIGETRLTVPAGLIRVPEQRGGGPMARLDLAMDAATMQPAGFRSAEAPDTRSFVFISLEQTRDGGDPANRAEELYNRFLTPEAVEAEGGLIKRAFRAKSPYDDEVLYIAAPDGKAFAARCGPINARAMEPTCLWLIRHGGLDLQVRFNPAHLGEWQKIAAGTFDVLAAMRSADGGAKLP